MHTEGSVHDEDWVEDFVEMGRSRLGSVENDLDKLGDDDKVKPSRTEKIMNSSSTNSLSALLSLSLV